MVRGKFDGPVSNVDASGKISHGTFVNGTKANDWVAGPSLRADQQLNEHVSKSDVSPQPPAEGPPRVAAVTLARPPTPATSAAPHSPPAAAGPAVQSRMSMDF